ncbi:hypothetical protein GOBAR_AA11970 [Gossypium barbadense]|uniref:DUF4283 domain-containing protein n=1 Tax=Gossypium barbadense TaxID=3634 RepID=A0A2P5XZD3_GOSBA|nr:hypothetical protein GOBAR_AA11970 [Gossypium barbadense]
MEKLSLIPDNVSSTLAVGDGDGSRSDSDRMTKKVRFKEGIEEEDTKMVEDLGSSPKLSWKDKLLGTNSGAIDVGKLGPPSLDADEDLEFLEGDIHKSIVNGRNIGYGALNNRISSLRNTAKAFHLMDIENGYFLAKFQSFDDYTKALAQGPWMVYGQYLTVQPWTKEFCPSQPYPSLVLAWIRLPGLPGYLYKKKIIEAIGSTIGKVVRLTLILTAGLEAGSPADSDINRPMVGSALRAVGSNIGERAEDPKLANVIQASTLEGSKNQALGPTQNDPGMPELIEIQSVNISEGLNSNSHTSVLFKEKEAADNSNMGKISLQDLDASKI